eukprot:5276188-Pyramimonas_sp.AAC.1
MASASSGPTASRLAAPPFALTSAIALPSVIPLISASSLSRPRHDRRASARVIASTRPYPRQFCAQKVTRACCDLELSCRSGLLRARFTVPVKVQRGHCTDARQSGRCTRRLRTLPWPMSEDATKGPPHASDES